MVWLSSIYWNTIYMPYIVLHYNIYIYIFIRFCLFAAPGGILPPGAGG